MGWTIRYLAYLLKENEIPFYAYDISHLFFADDVPVQVPPPPAVSVGRVTLVLALLPNRYRYALSSLPRRLVRNSYIIGYSVYELERLPADYRHALRDIDEIWTPSSFSAAAFSEEMPKKPVRVIPHIIPAPGAVGADRSAFQLPQDVFIVMAFCNVKSGTTRKNIDGAVQAFQQAFPHAEDVRLVLKISDQDWAPERTLQVSAYARDDRRIIVYSESLSDNGIWSFMACADVIISLHRTEGFGLVLAQALMLGKPLVTPLWSGPCDFLTKDIVYDVDFKLVPVDDREGVYNITGTRWMEPDVSHAARQLRKIRENPAAALDVGARGRLAIRHFMDPQAWTDILNQALCRGCPPQKSC
jgi:glycosyltransferase involved in cell wall biosynthesis